MRLLLALLLAAPLPAQIRVGGSSFFSGDQVVYSGGPSQGPQAVDVGLGLEVGMVSTPAEGALLKAGKARFSREKCAGTQVRLEIALRRRALAREETRLPELDQDLLGELVEEGRIPDLPRDPESQGNYSWWNYRVDPGRGQLRCRDHGSWRDALREAQAAGP